jgi:hypothetical protein
MDFSLTSEQEALRRRAANFAAEYIMPYAEQWSGEGRFPEEAVRSCARYGLTGLTVPQSYGGLGASTVAYSLVITELAAACASTAVTVAVSSMVAETICKFGTKAQQERYLPSILNGEFAAAAFALSEAGAGSDASSLRTSGVYEGNDVIIDGEKMWISSGTHSGVFVVWVRTAEGDGAKGISAFLVEPTDPGFKVSRKEEKMGLRASTTVSLEFDACRIPISRRLGEAGKGFRIAMQALDGGRIGVASQALGIARAALEAVDRYVDVHRHALNNVRRARLSELKIEYLAARLLTLQAAWLKDQGGAFSPQAAMAKAYSTETANLICQEAITLLGEDACTDAYPLERLFRDSRVTTIYEGTSEVQRIVISRSFLRE